MPSDYLPLLILFGIAAVITAVMVGMAKQSPPSSWLRGLGAVALPCAAGKPSRVNVIGGLGLCGGRWRLEWAALPAV
ncbi:MAG: hypothetical protein ACK4NB_01200 [Fimbriimonadales bacterium]